MLSVVVPLPLALLHHPPSALQPMLSRPRQQLLRYGHSAALLRARHTLASLVSSGQQPPRPLSTAATGARLINLYALSDEELANLLSEWNEKPYRVKQIRNKPKISDLKNWCLVILINGDNNFAVLHAS